MVAVVHDAEPRMLPRVGHPLQPLLAERVGPASHRPTVVAHLIRRERHSIPPRIGEQPGAQA